MGKETDDLVWAARQAQGEAERDLIRRAAAHARYLAGPPVEWDADSPDWEGWEVREQDRHGWWSRLIGRTRRPTRALHVATWDPAAGHAAAALLDAINQGWGMWAPYHNPNEPGHGPWHAALVLARRVLNEPEETT